MLKVRRFLRPKEVMSAQKTIDVLADLGENGIQRIGLLARQWRVPASQAGIEVLAGYQYITARSDGF